ncbi:MAG: glucose-1-phosphate thymidylyltransferase [Bacteroidota bacterium]|nr:glucose-1-phosphate thymidylyltransferase [Bacteroidota bacterium]
MKVILDDISCKDDLYPFTATRSVVDIRIGIVTIRDKWKLLNHEIAVLSELKENEINPKEVKHIPANIIPSQKMADELLQNSDFNNSEITERTLRYPWQIFQNNEWAITEDFELITQQKTPQKISSTNNIIGNNIFIEEGAIVEYCILNASSGAIYIGKDAEVMEGSIIRGPAAICEGSKIKMGTKVYGATTIGPYCIAGGEIKNSLLLGYSNKSHDGYLGDSVIGEWCNLGAGTSNSNIKNTAGGVTVWNPQKQKYISVGTKCGLLMGDYSRSAINTSFNTGTVVGVACNIFYDGFPPRYIESFSWGDKNYELEKALQHIDNWKKLKQSSITENEKNILSEIYHQKNKNA